MKSISREIQLEGSFNFRDLGGYETIEGYSVKRGKLFRSGNLSRLTENDLKIVNQLGIKTICDLRRTDEIEKFPDPALTGATWTHIPVVSDKKVVSQVGDLVEREHYVSKPGELLIHLNQKMASYTGTYRRVFEILLTAPQTPMLFHCMAGKDRTGVVAALILSALGVPREIIEEDYLYTNNTLDRMKAHFEELDFTKRRPINQDILDALFESRPEYIRAFFDEVETGFGGVDLYLEEAIGLTDKDITLMKRHLVE